MTSLESVLIFLCWAIHPIIAFGAYWRYRVTNNYSHLIGVALFVINTVLLLPLILHYFFA